MKVGDVYGWRDGKGGYLIITDAIEGQMYGRWEDREKVFPIYEELLETERDGSDC